MHTDFSKFWFKQDHIFSCVHNSISFVVKLIFARFSLVTRQKWQEKFDIVDLYIRQYVAASS